MKSKQEHFADQDYSQTKEEYACKVERKTQNELLSYEHHIIHQMQRFNGFTKEKCFVEKEGYLYMVFDLLGTNLEDKYWSMKKQNPLSIATIAHIGIQCVSRLEALHRVGYIHRDIKPENFAFGIKEPDKLFLIDFGLAKRYMDRKTKKHIPFRTGKEMLGTPRYATIQAHLGVEMGRRDDLEAVGTMLLYLLRGDLPWQGIMCPTAQDKFRSIGQMKLRMSVEETCHKMPIEMETYLVYTKGLKMEDEPDYHYLRSVLYQMACSHRHTCPKQDPTTFSSLTSFSKLYRCEWSTSGTSPIVAPIVNKVENTPKRPPSNQTPSSRRGSLQPTSDTAVLPRLVAKTSGTLSNAVSPSSSNPILYLLPPDTPPHTTSPEPVRSPFLSKDTPFSRSSRPPSVEVSERISLPKLNQTNLEVPRKVRHVEPPRPTKSNTYVLTPISEKVVPKLSTPKVNGDKLSATKQTSSTRSSEKAKTPSTRNGIWTQTNHRSISPMKWGHLSNPTPQWSDDTSARSPQVRSPSQLNRSANTSLIGEMNLSCMVQGQQRMSTRSSVASSNFSIDSSFSFF
ncbi:putative Casein kinase I [Blattamonas nauphoetae]|uniref:Casein kinase I n=1 Tax=Blattamonas nauphoetae TaxID=2049346 RepID=A0ABQ9Y3I0_9EUKA|nr:putative Casein kinase I [Blattamonas nauphoetae]